MNGQAANAMIAANGAALPSWRFSDPLFPHPPITGEAAGGNSYDIATTIAAAAGLTTAIVNIVAASISPALSIAVSKSLRNNTVTGIPTAVVTAQSLSPSNVAASVVSNGVSTTQSISAQNVIATNELIAVVVSAQASAVLVLNSALAAAAQIALNANAFYPPQVLDLSLAVSASMVDQLAEAVYAAIDQGVSVAEVQGITSTVALSEVLSAFSNLSHSQLLTLSADVALEIEEAIDATVSKILVDSIELGATTSDAELIAKLFQESIALELNSLLNFLLTTGAPQVLVDLIKLVTAQWAQADIIDEDFEPGQRI